MRIFANQTTSLLWLSLTALLDTCLLENTGMFAWNILCSVSTSPQLQLALGCSWCAAVTSWLLVTSAAAGAGDGPRLSAARLSRTPGTHDCTLTICCHLLTTTIRNINRNFNNNISPGQLNIVAGEYPKASNMWVSLGVQSPSHVWPWPWLYFEARSDASVWKMMQREVWWGVGSKQSWPS